MTSNAAVANAVKRKTELRETFHRIYCTLSSWMDICISYMPGCMAIIYGHPKSARALAPLSDHSVHRCRTVRFTKYQDETLVPLATQSRAPIECAAISIGSYPIRNRWLWLWRFPRSAIWDRSEIHQIIPRSHHGPHSPKMTRRITSKYRTVQSVGMLTTPLTSEALHACPG